MENAAQKKGIASIWTALWIRQSSSVSGASAAFIVNAVAFLIVLITFRYSDETILEWFFGTGDLRHSIGQILDVATLTLCGLNLFDGIGKIIIHLWTSYTSPPVPLTPVQRKLLGINEGDVRFKSSTPITTPLKPADKTSPFSFGDLSWLFHLTPKKRRSPGSPSQASSFNVYGSPVFGQSPASSTSRVRFSPSVAGYNYQIATSWTPTETGFDEILESIRRRGIELSTATAIDERSPLKSILKKTNLDSSAVLNTSTISDHSAKSYGSWRSPSSAHGPSPSSDYRRSSESISVSLAKSVDFSSLSSYRYQPSHDLSIESPTAAATGLVTASKIGQSPTSGRIISAADSTDPVWSRYGISSNEIVEDQSLRLRLWMSATILKPLIAEIDALNAKASKSTAAGKTPDFVIGESSLLHLQSVVASKFDQYTTLGALLPYLELSSNQNYLVERLRQLGAGDVCLTDFRWNSGSHYKNKPWDDRLPTDSDLIMHLFSTYMNSRLPLNPLCPEGKSFSCLYFVQEPAKPPADRKKGYLAIYQNSTTPPNFQLLVNNEILEVDKGKNNLFGTLLLFFHHLKAEYGAVLDSLSLGKAGLNILWVLE